MADVATLTIELDAEGAISEAQRYEDQLEAMTGASERARRSSFGLGQAMRDAAEKTIDLGAEVGDVVRAAARGHQFNLLTEHATDGLNELQHHMRDIGTRQEVMVTANTVAAIDEVNDAVSAIGQKRAAFEVEVEPSSLAAAVNSTQSVIDDLAGTPIQLELDLQMAERALAEFRAKVEEPVELTVVRDPQQAQLFGWQDDASRAADEVDKIADNFEKVQDKVEKSTESLKELRRVQDKVLGDFSEAERSALMQRSDPYAGFYQDRFETNEFVRGSRIEEEAEAGRKAAEAFVAAQEEVYQREMLRIKVAIAQGLLTPQEAQDQARAAAVAYNEELLTKIESGPGLRSIFDASEFAPPEGYEAFIKGTVANLKEIPAAAGPAFTGLSRLNNGLVTVIRNATGTNVVMAQLIDTLGTYAVGSVGKMTAWLAGLAALAYAFKKMTEESREARREHEKQIETLDQLAEARLNELDPGRSFAAPLEAGREDEADFQRRLDTVRRLIAEKERELTSLRLAPGGARPDGDIGLFGEAAERRLQEYREELEKLEGQLEAVREKQQELRQQEFNRGQESIDDLRLQADANERLAEAYKLGEDAVRSVQAELERERLVREAVANVTETQIDTARREANELADSIENRQRENDKLEEKLRLTREINAMTAQVQEQDRDITVDTSRAAELSQLGLDLSPMEQAIRRQEELTDAIAQGGAAVDAVNNYWDDYAARQNAAMTASEGNAAAAAEMAQRLQDLTRATSSLGEAERNRQAAGSLLSGYRRQTDALLRMNAAMREGEQAASELSREQFVANAVLEAQAKLTFDTEEEWQKFEAALREVAGEYYDAKAAADAFNASLEDQMDTVRKISTAISLLSFAGQLMGDTEGGAEIRGIASGAAQGAAIGTAIAPGVGTAIGAGLGAIGGFFGSRSDEREERRRLQRELEAALEQQAQLRRQLTFEAEQRGLALGGDDPNARRRALVSQQAFEILNLPTAEEVGTGAANAYRNIVQFLQEQELALFDLAEETRKGVEAAEEQIRIAEEQLAEAQKLVREYERSVERLDSFLENLAVSEPTLSPTQRLDEARTQFEALYELAQGGDVTAAESLPQAARALLDASREFNASGAGFQQDFQFVQEALTSVADAFRDRITEEQATIDKLEEQIQAQRDTITALQEGFDQAHADALAAFDQAWRIFLLQRDSQPGDPLGDGVNKDRDNDGDGGSKEREGVEDGKNDGADISPSSIIAMSESMDFVASSIVEAIQQSTREIIRAVEEQSGAKV